MLYLSQLFSKTVSEFLDHRGSRLAAALAYYTTFSIAPLLVMSIAFVGIFLGADAVHGYLKHELFGLLGQNAAEQIEVMVAALSENRHTGIVSSVLGIVALLFGATGVFAELKDSLNAIWGVEPKPELGIWGVITERLLSFAMVLCIAFLLLVSMILTAILSALPNWFRMPMSSGWIDFAVSSLVITMLFMMIFKYLPDARILWSDVWLGALVTALLFTVGKYLLGLYLANAAIESAYGAAGSIVVFLLWTYYSSLILFFGAEFTHVYTLLRGRRILPSSRARLIECHPQS